VDRELPSAPWPIVRCWQGAAPGWQATTGQATTGQATTGQATTGQRRPVVLTYHPNQIAVWLAYFGLSVGLHLFSVKVKIGARQTGFQPLSCMQLRGWP